MAAEGCLEVTGHLTSPLGMARRAAGGATTGQDLLRNSQCQAMMLTRS